MKIIFIRLLVATLFVLTFIFCAFVCVNVLMYYIASAFEENGLALTVATNVSFIISMIFGGCCAFAMVKALSFSKTIKSAMTVYRPKNLGRKKEIFLIKVDN